MSLVGESQSQETVVNAGHPELPDPTNSGADMYQSALISGLTAEPGDESVHLAFAALPVLLTQLEFLDLASGRARDRLAKLH